MEDKVISGYICNPIPKNTDMLMKILKLGYDKDVILKILEIFSQSGNKLINGEFMLILKHYSSLFIKCVELKIIDTQNLFKDRLIEPIVSQVLSALILSFDKSNKDFLMDC